MKIKKKLGDFIEKRFATSLLLVGVAGLVLKGGLCFARGDSNQYTSPAPAVREYEPIPASYKAEEITGTSQAPEQVLAVARKPAKSGLEKISSETPKQKKVKKQDTKRKTGKFPVNKISYEEADKIIREYDPEDARFHHGVITRESGYNTHATGNSGERGLMQIMPATWRAYSKVPFGRAYEPRENIKTGINYFNWIENYLSSRVPGWSKKSRKEQYSSMAAAYNCGVGRSEDAEWDVGKTPKSTQRYVGGIMEGLKK